MKHKERKKKNEIIIILFFNENIHTNNIII